MDIDFRRFIEREELGTRIRAIMGVPEEILTNEIIVSPTFIKKAENFVNNKIADYEETQLDSQLLIISGLYYICYLLCPGMYARLPKQMENVSTKTVLQNINWDEKALEFLDKANETMEEALKDLEEDNGGNTFAVLSAESSYPNTLI